MAEESQKHAYNLDIAYTLIEYQKKILNLELKCLNITLNPYFHINSLSCNRSMIFLTLVSNNA